jgi:hypothetical protein
LLSAIYIQSANVESSDVILNGAAAVSVRFKI